MAFCVANREQIAAAQPCIANGTYGETAVKPLIGITSACRIDDPNAPPFYGARVSYFESIEKAGGMAVGIPLSMDEAYLRELFDQLDGVLLPGGEDVNPARYNESAHAKLGTVSDMRDRLESLFARWSYQEGKALLGICRGIQIINVALGGSLYQDLPDQTGSELHRKPDTDDPWRTRSHSLCIERGSQLEQILGTSDLQVNSLHHQGVKQVAAQVRSTAVAGDGLVEAIEAPSLPFFMAVQCHPEVLWQSVDRRWLALFEALVRNAH